MSLIYPRVKAYLDALPDGIRSYPDAQTKGGVVRQFVEGMQLKKDRLPPELAQLFGALPADSVWVPEVHSVALALACADESGWTDDVFVRWAYDRNKALLNQPLNKLLLLVASPTMLLKGAASRNESFHRGLALVALPRGEREWELTMSFRPNLIPPLMVRCFVTGYQVALESSRVKDPVLDLVKTATDHALIRVRWAA